VDNGYRFDLFLQGRDPIQCSRVAVAYPVQRDAVESIPQDLDHLPPTVRAARASVDEEKWWSGSLLEKVDGSPIGEMCI
jgi:hypothetical protein